MRRSDLLQEIRRSPEPALEGLDRSARTPALVDVPRDAGAALRGLDLAIVGVGSVGMRLVELAARLGVRSLLLVDPASVKAESVLTHPVVPSDLGRAKVLVAGERAKSVSPETRVFTFEGAVEILPSHVLAGAGCVLLASDNLAAEVHVAQRSLHLGLPVLQCSVHGPTLTAQLRSISSLADGRGACLACGFGRRDWEDLGRGTRFSCTGADLAAAAPERSLVPTASFAHLCAFAASLGMMELTRRVVALGGAESRMIEYCGFTHRMVITRLAQSVDCPLDHARYRLEPRADDLRESTPLGLFAAAGYGTSDLGRVTLTVEGYGFASLAACGCPTHPVLGRFLREDEPPDICAGCGFERAPHPLHSHTEVPASALSRGLEHRLDSLGVGAPTSVRVRGERGGVLFHRIFPETSPLPETDRQGGAR
jgi:molybdopterin/thiamine biosynthesis adenylyltransferase